MFFTWRELVIRKKDWKCLKEECWILLLLMFWFQSCMSSGLCALAKCMFCFSHTQVTGLHTRLSRRNAMSCGLEQVKVGETVVASGLSPMNLWITLSLFRVYFLASCSVLLTVLSFPSWSKTIVYEVTAFPREISQSHDFIWWH